MFAKRIVICILLLTLCTGMFGCAYEQAYVKYAQSQAEMARAAGPIVTFHPDGKLASVGNPMVAMAMMNMKEPKDGWTSFFDWLKFATPFAAIWGLGASLANSGHGNTTNVSGSGNLTGNAAGPAGGASSWASPVTTTTTTTEMVGPVQ
jgi:hypothetical protein